MAGENSEEKEWHGVTAAFRRRYRRLPSEVERAKLNYVLEGVRGLGEAQPASWVADKLRWSAAGRDPLNSLLGAFRRRSSPKKPSTRTKVATILPSEQFTPDAYLVDWASDRVIEDPATECLLWPVRRLGFRYERPDGASSIPSGDDRFLLVIDVPASAEPESDGSLRLGPRSRRVATNKAVDFPALPDRAEPNRDSEPAVLAPAPRAGEVRKRRAASEGQPRQTSRWWLRPDTTLEAPPAWWFYGEETSTVGTGSEERRRLLQESIRLLKSSRKDNGASGLAAVNAALQAGEPQLAMAALKTINNATYRGWAVRDLFQNEQNWAWIDEPFVSWLEARMKADVEDEYNGRSVGLAHLGRFRLFTNNPERALEDWRRVESRDDGDRMLVQAITSLARWEDLRDYLKTLIRLIRSPATRAEGLLAIAQYS